MDYYSLFWGPGVISTIDEPRGAFTCRSSTLAVFVDSGLFRVLLLTVWGPKAISMVVEPQDVLTCWSTRLTVWAGSGPFLGLLLSYGGPEMTPGCVYVSVNNTHNFGRFWYVLCTVAHRCGVPERFPRLTIPGVRLRARRQPSHFWPMLTRFVNYYSPFWIPKRFP